VAGAVQDFNLLPSFTCLKHAPQKGRLSLSKVATFQKNAKNLLGNLYKKTNNQLY